MKSYPVTVQLAKGLVEELDHAAVRVANSSKEHHLVNLFWVRQRNLQNVMSCAFCVQ